MNLNVKGKVIDMSKKKGKIKKGKIKKEVSDGSTASYYELPSYACELQDLISYKRMNGQIAEIFRAAYRYGEVNHSPCIRDIKKIKFYADAEIKRLEMEELTDSHLKNYWGLGTIDPIDSEVNEERKDD